MAFLMSIITFHWPLWIVFPNSLGCPLSLGLSHPFTFWVEPTTTQLTSQVHNQFNKFTFVIILIILGLYYHV